MIGRIRQDFAVEDRMLPTDQPYSGFMVQNNMRKSQLALPPIGSAKLNGLYNTTNMPVFVMSAAQPIKNVARHAGVTNNHIAIISAPKRMPYPIVPNNY